MLLGSTFEQLDNFLLSIIVSVLELAFWFWRLALLLLLLVGYKFTFI